jgi:adenosylhomocysteine nucleosidase
MMKFIKTFLLLIVLTSIDLKGFSQQSISAIMGAMESEVKLLAEQMVDKKDTVIQGIPFSTGIIHGKEVVITRSGVGKVNAAIITTLVIDHFHPSQILFSGIAGGLNPAMHPGDVIVAEKVAYHDYGRKWPDSFETWATRNPSDFKYNPMYFESDSLLFAMAKSLSGNIKLQPVGKNIPVIHTGIILTGDMFLSDGKYGKKLRNKTGADAIEMEGAAVAQTAWQQKVPFLIIRSLSDSANDDAALDFTTYGKIAAENSAALILALLKML